MATYLSNGSLSNGLPAITWANSTGDAISSLMNNDYTSSGMSGRFAGLGSALLDRFESTGSDYSQSVSYGPPSGAGAYASLATLPQGKIDLSIKTKSGVTVEIEMDSENGGLSVSIKSSGKLSDSERGAIAKLADGFQNAIDGLSGQPPKLDLSGLTQFDTSAIASVSFKEDISQLNSPNISASYVQDSASRTLSIKTGDDNTINLKVDTSNPALWGTSKQRDAAVTSLLKQFDAANAKGHGDAALMSMFEQGFKQMNEDYGPAAPDALPGGQDSSSLVTGLADYTASIHDAPGDNAAHPGETDTFDYDVSQDTSLDVAPDGSGNSGTSGTTGSSDTTGITQRQSAHLKASFHQLMTGAGLKPMTTAMQPSSYDFTQLDDTAQSTVQLTAERGALVSATLNQSTHQTKTDTKHQNGVVTTDVMKPVDTSSKKDLLSILKPSIDNGDAKRDTPAWELAKTLTNALIQLNAQE
ncbi:hypothetical protein [Pararobbsia alpina]|uniref:hypothetical protein n=1 Tax=Pararobbsia alpina TaxID=621374 RepID=UPI0039A50664